MTDAYPPGWADGRSELQGADEPRCPGHPSGLHCAHWDTHDACCDCTSYITEDGDINAGIDPTPEPPRCAHGEVSG